MSNDKTPPTGTPILSLVKETATRLPTPTSSPVLDAIDGLREHMHERMSSIEVEVNLMRRALRQPSPSDTLPGIQAPPKPAAAPAPTVAAKLAKGSLASVKWSLVLAGLLGVAAQLATIRYPRLVGPLQTLQQIAEEASGSHVQQNPVPGSP